MEVQIDVLLCHISDRFVPVIIAFSVEPGGKVALVILRNIEAYQIHRLVACVRFGKAIAQIAFVGFRKIQHIRFPDNLVCGFDLDDCLRQIQIVVGR